MSFFNNIFGCPICHEALVSNPNYYECQSCQEQFTIKNNIPVFLKNLDESQSENLGKRQEFWDKGWENRISNDEIISSYSKLNEKKLQVFMKTVLDRYSSMKHHLVKEISKSTVKDKIVLDIGCGGGLQAAIFSQYNAKYIGVDFSYYAAKQASEYIMTLQGKGITAQADAERLPIMNESIDVVYSHGVLHHTPNTSITFDEIDRVLKPGGKAVIGLYVTFSPKFLVERLIGSLKVVLSKQKNWYSSGEGAWHSSDRDNAWTKTYTKKELINMLRKYNYNKLNIRKFSFLWGQALPPIGKYFDKTTIGQLGAFAMGPYFGDMWSISYEKK